MNFNVLAIGRDLTGDASHLTCSLPMISERTVCYKCIKHTFVQKRIRNHLFGFYFQHLSFKRLLVKSLLKALESLEKEKLFYESILSAHEANEKQKKNKVSNTLKFQ